LDTAGQEEFSAMREQYMISGEGFLLVYSITDRDSFEAISAYHQQILRVKDTETVPILLVGNKSDLEDGRRVAKNEGRFISEELGCGFAETSAKLGINVNESFLNLVRQIRDYNKELLHLRRISQMVMGPSPTMQLPGAGCWNSGCIIT